MRINHNGNEFAAMIGERVIEMKDYTKRVWQQSVLRLVFVMQLPTDRGGRMPVVTGFLRASLVASLSPIALGTAIRPDNIGPYVYNPTEIERVVMSAKVGEMIYLGYLANYAVYVEYGTSKFFGYGFQRLAVQAWPSIVLQTIAEMRGS